MSGLVQGFGEKRMRIFLTFMLVLSFAALTACATSAPEPVQTTPSVASAETVINGNDEAVELEELDVQEVPIVANAGSPDELICRTQRVTGSHMPVRVCRTRAQMEEERREAQEILRRTGRLGENEALGE